MQESQEDQKSQEDQPPSEEYIKANLQRYSPFYRQAMHFADPNVETLFYVAHDNFSSEKAVEKFKAFELFEKQKIVLVELNNAPRFRTSDVSESGPSEHQGGNSAHFTVKVKDKDSETLRELIIYGDGKCGIASLFVALNEISRGDIPLLPEVLIRDDIVLDASTSHQDGDIVQSDLGNHYDALLKKIYKPLVKRDENGHDEIGALKLHHCVKDDLEFDSDEFIIIRRSLVDKKLKEKVKNLLINTENPHWLTPKDVHEILTDNLAVLAKIREGKLKNISAGKVFSVLDAIPSTILPGQDNQQVSLEITPLPSTFSREGIAIEGMELEPDKTLKHEFRIIVLNIVHEWIDAESKKGDGDNFSKMEEVDFLKNLIAKKLGSRYADKIQTAFGGGEITFKSLLAIDEVGAGVGDENLKKERETFYSAPCSFSAGGQGEAGVIDNPNSKVWERITDVIYKYNAHAYQTSNDDFKTSFTSALEASMQIDGLNYTEKQFLGSTLTLFGERNRSDSSMLLPTPAPYQLDLPGHTQAAHAHANAGHSPLKMEIESDFSPGHVQPAPGNAKAGHYHSRMEVTSHSPSSTGQSTPVEPGTDQILGPLQRDPCAQPLFPGHLFYPAQSAGGAHARLGHAPAQPVAHAELAGGAPARLGHAPARLGHAPAQPVATTELGGSSEELLGVIIPNTDPPQPGPTSNPPKAKPDQDLDKFKELIEAVLGVIGNLGDVIKTKYEEARKNLLEKVKELEKSIEQPQEKKPVDQGSEANETPASELLKPVFTVLRSCLGDRDNIR